MEVAIRAVNLVWALATLEEWRPLEASLRDRLIESLRWHGRHIRANLEGTPYLRSNHYLSDILGLLVLGWVLNGEPEAPKWFGFASREFEREILRQVHPDGVSFEAHEPAVVDELTEHTPDQPWWLGYLDTGAHDIVFPLAPKLSLYWDWTYLLVEAGPEQAEWPALHSPGW